MKPTVLVTRPLPQPAYDELAAACDVILWDEDTPVPAAFLHEHIGRAEGLICALTERVDAALLDAAPRLKVVSQVAVGYDNIDVAAAAARGIAVGNTPGVLTGATADFTWALLLAAARRVGEARDYVRDGRWQVFNMALLLGQEAGGATLGIIGFGRIGQAVARRAMGFDMRVLYHSRAPHPETAVPLGAEYRALDELLCEADFVSLHVALNEGTRGLIGARELGLMKKTAVLINTARGPVVDTDALYTALQSGQIAAAALDVTDPEPLPADHPLLTLPNCLVTPHIASADTVTRVKMAQTAVRNCLAGLRGEPLPFPVLQP
jgi:glyoxylate reductase